MTARMLRAPGGASLSSWNVPALPSSGDLVGVGVSILVAVGIGSAVAVKPAAALLPVALLAGLWLLVDARMRILFVVFGGLLTLQSSGGLGSLKLLYLAGVLASVGGALFAFSRDTNTATRWFASPLLRTSVAVSALILVSFLVAKGNGVARVDWLRDVAPYVLFAVAPLFALDAQRAFSRSGLVRLLVLAGLVATASFSTHWVEQRGIARLPFSRFALSSFLFPAALFAYAAAAALHEKWQRTRWLALAALVFALLVVTGTRTTLILAAAPLAAAIAARRDLGVRFFRLILLAPALILVIAVAAVSVVEATNASTHVISKRISILKSSGTSSDGSYRDRQAQTHAASEVFHAHSIFGAGPGTYFTWRQSGAGKRTNFILDSPMDFPAKFGVVGLAILVFLIFEYGGFLRRALRFNHPRTETLALVAYIAMTTLNSFLTNPFEDKGWTLGLIVLLALAFRTSGLRASDGVGSRPSAETTP
jgi:O-antigen ligase